jgi:hypothetical protein
MIATVKPKTHGGNLFIDILISKPRHNEPIHETNKAVNKDLQQEQAIIDETIVRQMIAGQVPLSGNIIREDPETPEDTPEADIAKQPLPAEKLQSNLSQVSE